MPQDHARSFINGFLYQPARQPASPPARQGLKSLAYSSSRLKPTGIVLPKEDREPESPHTLVGG